MGRLLPKPGEPSSEVNRSTRTPHQMIRTLPLFALLSLLAAPITSIGAADDFPPDFLIGRYHLIGKLPDGGESFSGHLTITSGKEGMRIERTIGERRVTGSARMETALAGEARVLRMRFQEEGVRFESTCLVRSDLDNYARISCYRYRKDGKTRSPGLEALFIDHGEEP